MWRPHAVPQEGGDFRVNAATPRVPASEGVNISQGGSPPQPPHPAQGRSQPDGKATERQDEPSDSGAVLYDPSTQPHGPETGQAHCPEEGNAVLAVSER